MRPCRDQRFALDRLLATKLADMAPWSIVGASWRQGIRTARYDPARCRRARGSRRPLDRKPGPALRRGDRDLAPPFYGEPNLAAVWAITVPSLHITATDDVIELPGYYSGAADRLAVFNAIATPHKLLAVFQGGSHSMFTDRPFTGGAALNPMVKDATADLALSFFDLAFDGDGTALTRWNMAWQPILARPPVVTSPLASMSRPRKPPQRSLLGDAAAAQN